MLVLPRLAQRRGAAAFICRAYFLLCGLPVHRIGMDRLPAGPCIVVANHASYLDGPLLFAVLPPRFAFVIKKEASRIPLAGLLMRRLGHHFVNRSNRHEGANDARRILRAVSQGQSVAFFPEGTFGVQDGRCALPHRRIRDRGAGRRAGRTGRDPGHAARAARAGPSCRAGRESRSRRLRR